MTCKSQFWERTGKFAKRNWSKTEEKYVLSGCPFPFALCLLFLLFWSVFPVFKNTKRNDAQIVQIPLVRFFEFSFCMFDCRALLLFFAFVSISTWSSVQHKCKFDPSCQVLTQPGKIMENHKSLVFDIDTIARVLECIAGVSRNNSLRCLVTTAPPGAPRDQGVLATRWSSASRWFASLKIQTCGTSETPGGGPSSSPLRVCILHRRGMESWKHLPCVR